MAEHCKGIKKNGEPCKMTANLVGGYCRLHRRQQGSGASGDHVVLERSTMGIPRYVPCAEDPKGRWIVLAAVSVVALLAITMSLIFCCRRKR